MLCNHFDLLMVMHNARRRIRYMLAQRKEQLLVPNIMSMVREGAAQTVLNMPTQGVRNRGLVKNVPAYRTRIRLVLLKNIVIISRQMLGRFLNANLATAV